MRITCLAILVLGLVCAFGCNKEPEAPATTTPATQTAQVPKGNAEAGARGLSPAGENAASHVGSSMKGGN